MNPPVSNIICLLRLLIENVKKLKDNVLGYRGKEYVNDMEE
jgi:hypothetical protein